MGSGDGLAPIVKGETVRDRGITSGGTDDEIGVRVKLPEAAAAGGFGLSVRVSVPEGCPVVPLEALTFSHDGTPLTVNGIALPSFATTTIFFELAFRP